MNYTVVSAYNYEGNFRNTSTYDFKTKRKNKFIRGAVYRIKNKICSDKSICYIDEKTYLLKGIVKQIRDVKFNGVVMKQLTGESPNQIFTLSKEQCEILHIKYERGLEVFPSNTKFVRVVEDFPNEKWFDKNDFSSYPHCVVDGTIREIFVRLDDFCWKDGKRNKLYNKRTKKYYRLNKENVKGNCIINVGCLKIKSNIVLKSRNCKGSDKELVRFRPNEFLPYYIVPIDSNEIILCINLTDSVVGGFTEDGYLGLFKEQFKNKKFEELFTLIDDKENA